MNHDGARGGKTKTWRRSVNHEGGVRHANADKRRMIRKIGANCGFANLVSGVFARHRCIAPIRRPSRTRAMTPPPPSCFVACSPLTRRHPAIHPAIHPATTFAHPATPRRHPQSHRGLSTRRPRPPTATSDLVPPTPHPHPLPRLHRILSSVYPFSRPHTIHGTLVSILSLTLLASLHSATPLAPLATLRTSLPPALLTNLYIVGLNQLHDIHIDRVNKPALPLPSGRLTLPEARVISYTALLLALTLLPLIRSPSLNLVVLASAALGYAYSAPPIRLKRFAALASAAIMAVRGALVNTCFYLHAGGPTPFPAILRFALLFFTLFGTVIALLKDVPDIPGDRRFGIRTFSVRLGATAVFRVCVALLVGLFATGGAVYAALAWRKLLAAHVWRGTAAAVGAAVHLVVAGWLARRARSVTVEDRTSITRFYMTSWKVFYLEYLLLPLAAL